MIFRVYGLEANSYVDGPGVRLAIFFQGCLHHCKGCQNPGSWPMYGGEKMDTEFIKKLMVSDSLLSGITLSGVAGAGTVCQGEGIERMVLHGLHL